MNKQKIQRLLILFAALITLIIGIVYQLGYRINLTASYPLGIWKLIEGAPKKSDIVIFCPPDNELFREARERGYIRYGFCPGFYGPLIKKIVGVSGDQIMIDESGVWVNGKLLPKSRLLNFDSEERVLPYLENQIIPSAKVLLMSDYSEKSFDGRYFGTISKKSISNSIQLIYKF